MTWYCFSRPHALVGQRGQALTSTATSGSPLPLLAPSTTAATISSRYLVRVNPSISLASVSEGPTSRLDLSRFSRVVCFLSDESRLPGGPTQSHQLCYLLYGPRQCGSPTADPTGAGTTMEASRWDDTPRLTSRFVQPVLLDLAQELLPLGILGDIVGSRHACAPSWTVSLP
jgi:hypothetical protein